jgi:hypothetical protein
LFFKNNIVTAGRVHRAVAFSLFAQAPGDTLLAKQLLAAIGPQLAIGESSEGRRPSPLFPNRWSSFCRPPRRAPRPTATRPQAPHTPPTFNIQPHGRMNP